MIKCTEQYNTKCLACRSIPYRLICVGAFYMCPGCFNEIFDGATEIEANSDLGKVYYKWLEKYKENIT